MPHNTSKPDILLFGPEIGAALMRPYIEQECTIVTEFCESGASAQDAKAHLTRAIANHNPHSVCITSHTLSLKIEGDGDTLYIHRTLPPLAQAARITCTRHVALLAKAQTLAHPTTQRQIALFAERGLRIIPLPCDTLAYMAHRYQQGLLPDIMALRDFTTILRDDPRIDTVVLASGTASILHSMLEKAAFRPFYWVDGIAVSARHLLASGVNRASASQTGTHIL